MMDKAWKTTGRELVVDYTNHRGERRLWLVEPLSVWFGKTVWHDCDAWVMHALDLVAKGEPQKEFLLVNIHQILPWVKGEDDKGWVCGLCDGKGLMDMPVESTTDVVSVRCTRCHGSGHLS